MSFIQSKSIELEQRLAKLEMCCQEFSETLAVMRRQLTAIQAQIDYMAARIDRR